MSVDKNKKFEECGLSIERADFLYWEIKGIDLIVEDFVSKKRRQQLLLTEELLKIQEECGRTPEGHDYVLLEKAQLEIDRDKLACQKCGHTT